MPRRQSRCHVAVLRTRGVALCLARRREDCRRLPGPSRRLDSLAQLRWPLGLARCLTRSSETASVASSEGRRDAGNGSQQPSSRLAPSSRTFYGAGISLPAAQLALLGPQPTLPAHLLAVASHGVMAAREAAGCVDRPRAGVCMLRGDECSSGVILPAGERRRARLSTCHLPVRWDCC